MREPFTRHARLLQGAENWKRAREAYKLACRERRKAVRQSYDEDGISSVQIALAYDLSVRRIQKILNQKENDDDHDRPDQAGSRGGAANGQPPRAARTTRARRPARR